MGGVYDPRSWGMCGDPGKAALRLGCSGDQLVRDEFNLENAVSRKIGAMPFLWLGIDDTPGRDSLRSKIERNAIALLSNYNRPALDPPSTNWLGHHSDREKVRLSGLWNNNHVSEQYDPCFLDEMDRCIELYATTLSP